jgi:threonine/homoserine/homoserine lactone efflux protein
MGRAIGDILPLAIGVAISPLPVVAIVLMLATPRGRANGGAFALGWVAGLTAVCVVVLAAASGNAESDSGNPATWVSVLKLGLGCGAVLLGFRQWQKRPKAGDQASLPKWMATIDRFTAVKSLGFGVVLSAANPKNLGLAVSAATSIAQTGISAGSEAVAAAVFVAIASLSIVGPVAAYLLLGDRAKKSLGELKDTLAAHNAVIMAVLVVVLGVKLVGDGIAGLSA